MAEQQHITCSVGIAANKFLAKLASVHCKPDGLLVIPADGVLEFLHPLPVSALWGVGAQTGKTLARLGLRTVGDIAATPVGVLERDLGKAAAAHLSALASGRDDRRVETGGGGEEHRRRGDLRRRHRRPRGDPPRAAAAVRPDGAGLRASGYAARTVVVKLRKADFTTITRSRTLPEPTDVAQRIYATACALYEASGLSARDPAAAGRRAGGRPGPGRVRRDPAGPGRAAAGVVAGRRVRARPHHRPVRVRGGPARRPWWTAPTQPVLTGQPRPAAGPGGSEPRVPDPSR